MKLYLQSETESSQLAVDQRVRQLVLETDASPAVMRAALESLIPNLGGMTVIPAAAHEANLKALLVRDLAAQGITSGTGETAELTLKILRKPGQTGSAGQAEVIGLSYTIQRETS